MKKIVVSGYYGYQNSGDDAILHSICQDILELEQEISITVLSNQPELTRKEYGVNSEYRFSMKKVLKEIRTCDILLMGGGSLIQDATSNRSLYYYLLILWLGILFNKSCILYGNGIGPVKHFYNIPLIRMVLNRVQVITLREHLSKTVLDKMKITKPLIQVTADPVFNLRINPKVSLEQIYQMERIDPNKKIVGVMFRSWNHEESYTKKMAKICDSIIETYDYQVVFVPMKHPADLIVAFEIMKKMHHHDKARVIEHHYQEELLIHFMGKMELILSMRLHALIYAALQGVPMIGFNYDLKVEYYTKELGVPCIEDMRHIDVNKIMELIEGLHKNKANYQKDLSLCVQKLRIDAKKNSDFLLKLL